MVKAILAKCGLTCSAEYNTILRHIEYVTHDWQEFDKGKRYRKKWYFAFKNLFKQSLETLTKMKLENAEANKCKADTEEFKLQLKIGKQGEQKVLIKFPYFRDNTLVDATKTDLVDEFGTPYEVKHNAEVLKVNSMVTEAGDPRGAFKKKWVTIEICHRYKGTFAGPARMGSLLRALVEHGFSAMGIKVIDEYEGDYEYRNQKNPKSTSTIFRVFKIIDLFTHMFKLLLDEDTCHKVMTFERWHDDEKLLVRMDMEEFLKISQPLSELRKEQRRKHAQKHRH